MIEIEMSDLQNIAYNRGYLPYDFFIEIGSNEISQQKHNVYWIKKTGQFFVEM